MELIKAEEANKGANSEVCKTLEYSFSDKSLDLGIATITSRYPKDGYCVNLISKELVYVLNGEGELYIKDKVISFKKGDAILIDKNEEYYWKANYCEIALVCTPAFQKSQYKIINNK